MATKTRERIVAKGFRNPFRFTFDPTSGEIYTGNVGSSEIEEIDRFQAPPTSLYNSGWPCYEGIRAPVPVQGTRAQRLRTRCTRTNRTRSRSRSSPTATNRRWCPKTNARPTRARRSAGSPSTRANSSRPNTRARSSSPTPSAAASGSCSQAKMDTPTPRRPNASCARARSIRGSTIAEGPDGDLYYADLLSEEGTRRLDPSDRLQTQRADRAPGGRTALRALRLRRQIRNHHSTRPPRATPRPTARLTNGTSTKTARSSSPELKIRRR